MMTEREIRQRLHKVEALRRGAATQGEREAAEAALARLKAKLRKADSVETPFGYGLGLPGPWPVHLFMACCAAAMVSGFAILRATAPRR
jgi:hypothetical protein